jgi:hypothetical protein
MFFHNIPQSILETYQTDFLFKLLQLMQTEQFFFPCPSPFTRPLLQWGGGGREFGRNTGSNPVRTIEEFPWNDPSNIVPLAFSPLIIVRAKITQEIANKLLTKV